VSLCAIDRQNALLVDDLRRAFDRVVRRGDFILGEEVARFEEEFAKYCGASDCVGVASGTAALMLLLEANGIGPGDEVIVPAYTFIATALAVARVGAAPVLCDVDAATGLIDPGAALAAVGPRTAAVIAVHLFGQPCEMAALRGLTEPRGLLLLEDAAQAHGARYQGRRTGALGAGAAFSFYPSKNLGALGDGGAVCTGDPQVAARIRRLRNLGQQVKGNHVELGLNERLDGLQAALLRAKLPYLDGWNAARARHAERYRGLLGGRFGAPQPSAGRTPVHHLFPVRVAQRDRVARELEERGVETGVHYNAPVHQHKAWEGRRPRRGSVINAEAWAASELSLPMHPHLTNDEIDYVVDMLQATAAEEI
jgi:dTDP-3-amino-3,4,6-trideoxy-alpha-D-glucose transaminase